METNDPLASISNSADDLLRRLRAGDEEASAEIFQTYLMRLTALARQRLSQRLAARVDAEDIVMSAYRSFFLRARRGDFHLENSAALWRLLAEITLHKLYRQTTYQTAQHRTPNKETTVDERTATVAAPREVSPEVAAALADEVGAITAQLPSEVREAFELRLQDYDIAEIAHILNCSERTVRRRLDQVKEVLRTRFPEQVKRMPTQAQRKPHDVPKPAKPLRLLAMPQYLLTFANYTLLKQVGTGSMGKVYQARNHLDNSIVAVKFLKRAVSRNIELALRFVNEARILSHVNQAGLIKIHGVGRTPNHSLFLAMDFHERGDLQQRINQGSIEIHELIRWLRTAAEAVQVAHSQGVIHCDLKPSNLLLTAKNSVVVTDFGLARPSTDTTLEHFGGTPPYLAPEQLSSSWGKVGPHTDVYGLGGILYAMLFHRPPRTGSFTDVLQAVSRGDEIEVNSGKEEPLARICRRCLSSNPLDRYASAAELAVALNTIRTG